MWWRQPLSSWLRLGGRHMLDSRWAAARSVLLVRLDNIGDVVLLSAAVRAIRENLPQARLTLLASPAGSQGAALLPGLDEVLAWRAVWQDLGHLPLDPSREMALVELLKFRRFDAAIVFTSFSQSPHGAAYACYLAGIPLRLGESKEFGGTLLSTEVRGLPDHLYQAERNLRLIEAVGFAVGDRKPHVAPGQRAVERARVLLASRGIWPGQPYVVVHPGASCQARRYPLDRFAVVARLLRRATGLPVVVTGAGRGAAEMDAVACRSAQVTSIAGLTSVEELAAVVAGARLVVCNDSLPMHLAAALGVPAVVTFSGTDLESQWVSPYVPNAVLRRETKCSPCYLMECPYRLECLDIPPREVVDRAVDLLSSPRTLGSTDCDPNHEPGLEAGQRNDVPTMPDLRPGEVS